MRRLSGVLLIGALMLLPALTQGHLGNSARVAAQANKLAFEGDVVLWQVAIKPDKTGDFETLMGKVKEALTKSDKPERKAQAATWKIYKMAKPLPDGNIAYLLMLQAPVKDADYTLLNILYEANTDPAAQKALYDQYRGAFAATLAQTPYTAVLDMGK